MCGPTGTNPMPLTRSVTGAPPPVGVTHQAGVAVLLAPAIMPTSSTLISPAANMLEGATPAFGLRK